MMSDRSRLFMPGLLLVGVGMILLAINFDLFDIKFGVFWWNFWPLLIILAGLFFLIKDAVWHGTTAIILLGVAIWSVSYAPAGLRNYLHTGPSTRIAEQQLDEPLDGALQRLKFSLDLDARELNIRSASDSTKAYQANFKDMVRIEEKTARLGNELQLTLSRDGKNGSWYRKSDGGKYAAMYLHTGIPTELDLRSGADAEKLDFSDIQLAQLKLKTDAASSNLKFGLKSNTLNAEIDAEGSSITLQVPKTANLVINLDTNDSSNNFEQVGLSPNGNTYTLSSSGNRAATITLHLKLDSCSVKLERL